MLGLSPEHGIFVLTQHVNDMNFTYQGKGIPSVISKSHIQTMIQSKYTFILVNESQLHSRARSTVPDRGNLTPERIAYIQLRH